MLPRWLRRFLFETQRTPLRLAYRALYAVALGFVVGRLRQTRGVRSVYLVGGLVEGPVYGLSDIDLVLLVDDPDGYTALRVVELLAWLRTLVPMLEAPSGIGVYRADDVGRALRRSPLLHYRLVDRPHRLLHGPDTLPRPASAPAPARRARAEAEVGALWALALDKWAGADPNRFFSKLCARAYQAVLYAETGDLVPRARALALLGEDVGFLPADHLEVALAPARFAEGAVGLDGVLGLVLACMARLARAAEPAPAALEAGDATLSFAGGARACVQALGAPALAALRSLGFEASLRLNLGAHDDPLFCAAEHARLHVALPEVPAAADLAALLAVARAHAAAHVFLDVGGALVPLSAPARYGIARAGAHPELVDPAGLAGDGAASSAPVTLGIPAARAAALRETLAERRRATLELVRTGGHLRVPPRDRARLVVNALEGSPAGDEATIHLVGAAGACAARATEPAAVAALAPLAATFAPGAVAGDCPRALVERVVAGGADAAAGPAPAPLRLSVVICTRDRAPRLREALRALVGQRRPPDEVVVVDNGSTDDTPAVLASFATALPLVTVFLAAPSIPAARNAGARASTGDVICYTDDDAVADVAWLAEIEATFLEDPAIGIVGGDAPAAPAQRGLVPDFLRQYMEASA
jgi:predicted nucleotidyltransferase